jgi:hypothetical protein
MPASNLPDHHSYVWVPPQRMYPSRLVTMHARPLMLEDELFMFVGIKRLVRLFLA